MPELRKDPIVDRWVIISTERQKRPHDYPSPGRSQQKGFCPFCYGNEEKTPREILAFRSNNSPPNATGWDLRVVPNKFPALKIEGDLNRVGEGMFDKMNGIGAHEVIIENPNHDLSLERMPLKVIENCFLAFQMRMQDLKKDPRFRYTLIFKNHGEAAGATLEHSHSQLIALPIIPGAARAELDGSKRHFNYKERCIFCDILAQESTDGRRIVCENEKFIALCPFAPRFPFETWILPKPHTSAYDEHKREDLSLLAQIFQETMMRIGRSLDDPPYNFVLHSAPNLNHVQDYYHWHLEIMPKTTRTAAFEEGTGFYINHILPEYAAEILRSAKI